MPFGHGLAFIPAHKGRGFLQGFYKTNGQEVLFLEEVGMGDPQFIQNLAMTEGFVFPTPS